MWQLLDRTLHSRLILGTALYPSPQLLHDAITASTTEIVTVSLRREMNAGKENYFWKLLQQLNCTVLPNTAGCYSAKEAITTAQMAREVFSTHWVKLEVIGDEYTLQPNLFELVVAAKKLVTLGFEVFPYCTEDLVSCQRLVDVGCNVLMPWASPIGSGQGLMNPFALKLLRERFSDKILIVDAGIGKPSDAVQVMEWGYDGVLLNSAVALSPDPIKMAQSFNAAIHAGRDAFEAGMMPKRNIAQASTPLIGKPILL